MSKKPEIEFSMDSRRFNKTRGILCNSAYIGLELFLMISIIMILLDSLYEITVGIIGLLIINAIGLILSDRINAQHAMKSMLSETVEYDDTIWCEEREIDNIIRMNSSISDIKIPDGHFAYKINSPNGDYAYYISPFPIEGNNETISTLSKTGRMIESQGHSLFTSIIGSLYDPEIEKIIPIKMILVSSSHRLYREFPIESEPDAFDEMASDLFEVPIDLELIADTESVIETYGYANPSSYTSGWELSSSIESMKQKLYDSITELAITKDREANICGVYHDGTALIDIEPPNDDNKSATIKGYRCFLCGASHKELSTIEEVDGIMHFKCEYCGSINRVDFIKRGE